jgi:hypothetical protein
MKNFEDLVKNKNVVIVGPAHHLTGSNFGKIIDSYDVVVKINGLLYNKNPKDYGARIDVLTTNLEFIRNNQLTDDLLIKKGIKFILCKRIFNNETQIPFKVLRTPDHKLFENSPAPLNGINAINEIINNKPKELFITGFDFYTSGRWFTENYYPTSPEYTGSGNPKWDFKFVDPSASQSNSLHRIEVDFMFLADLCKTNSNIKLDNKLKDLFNLYEKQKSLIK